MKRSCARAQIRSPAACAGAQTRAPAVVPGIACCTGVCQRRYVNPDVSDGDLLWTPTPEQVAEANVTAFTGWLGRERGLHFDGYHALWRWSVTDLDGFWQAVWDHFGIASSSPPAQVLGSRAMPGAQWFPGARLNYAEHVLRNE